MTSAVAPQARGSLRLRVAVALVPCLLGLFIAAEYLSFMTSPQTLASPFADAWTYQAAGERLNAGHDLYNLGPGDRPVLEVPGLHAPLLSPPPIAVVWRPIAWLPLGFDAWVIACWIAILGTTFYLVVQTGIRGAIVASLLAPAIGEQLAACNVAAFFPLLMVVAWKARRKEIGGVAVALMAAAKLTPASLAGWLVGSGLWRALAGFAAALAVVAALTFVGAGSGSFLEYIDVARTTSPSTSSLSGLSGIGWVSPAFLVAGTLFAAGLGRRWPRASFVTAVVVSVFGTPALYLSGLVTLLACLAPFSDGQSEPDSIPVAGAPEATGRGLA
jgi:Glycosyltransferase family 87